MNDLFRNKLVLLVTSVLILGFGYAAVQSALRAGKTKVEIVAVPDDSTILINEKPAKPGTHYLKPGDYTITASREGFKDDTLKVKVEDSQKLVELIPAPDSEDAQILLKEFPEYQIQREMIGGRRANDRGQAREDLTPLIALLPTTEILGPFSIDYGPSKTREDGVFLEISDSSPKGRVNAIKWIRDRGMDPTDLEIKYVDFTSPLTGKSGAQ